MFFIYSFLFYVGWFGYKVCVRVYLNGDGIGKDEYMFLFFVVMKGEYDVLLFWLFCYKVIFRLLDQGGLVDVIDLFCFDFNSFSFKKFILDMNIVLGCLIFILYCILWIWGYVWDDMLFIKVIVDMGG